MLTRPVLRNLAQRVRNLSAPKLVREMGRVSRLENPAAENSVNGDNASSPSKTENRENTGGAAVKLFSESILVGRWNLVAVEARFYVVPRNLSLSPLRPPLYSSILEKYCSTGAHANNAAPAGFKRDRSSSDFRK